MRRRKQTSAEQVRWLLLDIRDDDAKLLDDVAKFEDRPRAYIARKALLQYLQQHEVNAQNVNLQAVQL